MLAAADECAVLARERGGRLLGEPFFYYRPVATYQQHAFTDRVEFSAADCADSMAADLDASPVLSRAPVIAMTPGGMVGSLLSDIADPGSRKSANMTECVPVPSSEHVAEIVGRQGIIASFACFRAVFVLGCCFVLVIVA